MMSSLFAAVSGLKTHQQRMDVIGNNIANVNTPGFKRSRMTFQDMLYQTIRGASRPVDGGRGGTNPMQIGMGVSIGSIDTIMTGSSPQDTGKNTDLAIEGDGFFVVSDGSRNYYTRAGAFDFDEQGYLVTANGMHVMGWMAKDGVITPNPNSTEPIKIDLNAIAPAKTTDKINFSGNLDANSSSQTVAQAVYDVKGNKYMAEFTFEKFDPVNYPNAWKVTISKLLDAKGNDITSSASVNGYCVIAFNNGIYDNDSYLTQINQFSFTAANGAGQVTFAPDFSQMTQFVGVTTVAATQNGYPAGSLEGVSFDTTGTLNGVFSNGITRPLAQLALALFNNPGGLTKEGNTLFSESNNSGQANLGPAGQGGLGTIKPASLEMSNVDLAQEFTEMIITQRGFQANSRVITASDEMLQELVNLKR